MAGNTIIIPISLPKELAQELDKAAKNRAMTRSEYVRSLLRRQLEFAGLETVREEFAQYAKKAGIKTFKDSVKAVREARRKKK